MEGWKKSHFGLKLDSHVVSACFQLMKVVRGRILEKAGPLDCIENRGAFSLNSSCLFGCLFVGILFALLPLLTHLLVNWVPSSTFVLSANCYGFERIRL